MSYTIFVLLICFVCVLLTLVIMVQNPKGGGLSSTFGGGGAMISSVAKTNQFLDKTTWTLVSVLVILVILSSMVTPGRNTTIEDEILENVQTPVLPSSQGAIPAMPAQGNAVPSAE